MYAIIVNYDEFGEFLLYLWNLLFCFAVFFYFFRLNSSKILILLASELFLCNKASRCVSVSESCLLSVPGQLAVNPHDSLSVFIKSLIGLPFRVLWVNCFGQCY